MHLLPQARRGKGYKKYIVGKKNQQKTKQTKTINQTKKQGKEEVSREAGAARKWVGMVEARVMCREQYEMATHLPQSPSLLPT